MKLTILSVLCSYSFIYLVTCIEIPSGTVPPRNNYSVTSNDVVCVVMEAGIELVVPYTEGTENYTQIITVPSHPYMNGSCSDGINILNVYFNDTWTLSFTFTTTQKASSYKMDKIKLHFELDRMNYTHVTNLSDINNKVSFGGSYKCQGQTDVSLQGGVTIHIYDLQYRAFSKTNSSLFAENNVQDCALSVSVPETNMAATLSVGVALGVIIVLVVLIYVIITRAKGHKYGYT